MSKCRKCDGTGKILRPDNPTTQRTFKEVTCPECNGRGFKLNIAKTGPDAPPHK